MSDKNIKKKDLLDIIPDKFVRKELIIKLKIANSIDKVKKKWINNKSNDNKPSDKLFIKIVSERLSYKNYENNENNNIKKQKIK